MGFKVALPFIGLVRGDPNGKSHRAPGKPYLQEMCSERYSSSVTLDYSRTGDNVYYRDGVLTGAFTGEELWDEICADADAYAAPYRDKKGVERTRKLRADAPVALELIVNPPAEMVIALKMSKDDVARFTDNVLDVLHRIEPRVFNRSRIKALVYHNDEGVPEAYEAGYDDGNVHVVYEPRDDDGKYWGKLIDWKLYNVVNREYPRLMRELYPEWQLDDLDVYDPEKAAQDENYKAERIAKRKAQGKSVTEHVNKKIRDAARAEASARFALAMAEQEAAAKVAQAEQEAENIGRSTVDLLAGAEAAIVRAAVADGAERAATERQRKAEEKASKWEAHADQWEGYASNRVAQLQRQVDDAEKDAEERIATAGGNAALKESEADERIRVAGGKALRAERKAKAREAKAEEAEAKAAEAERLANERRDKAASDIVNAVSVRVREAASAMMEEANAYADAVMSGAEEKAAAHKAELERLRAEELLVVQNAVDDAREMAAPSEEDAPPVASEEPPAPLPPIAPRPGGSIDIDEELRKWDAAHGKATPAPPTPTAKPSARDLLGSIKYAPKPTDGGRGWGD